MPWNLIQQKPVCPEPPFVWISRFIWPLEFQSFDGQSPISQVFTVVQPGHHNWHPANLEAIQMTSWLLTCRLSFTCKLIKTINPMTLKRLGLCYWQNCLKGAPHLLWLGDIPWSPLVITGESINSLTLLQSKGGHFLCWINYPRKKNMDISMAGGVFSESFLQFRSTSERKPVLIFSFVMRPLMLKGASHMDGRSYRFYIVDQLCAF